MPKSTIKEVRMFIIISSKVIFSRNGISTNHRRMAIVKKRNLSGLDLRLARNAFLDVPLKTALLPESKTKRDKTGSEKPTLVFYQAAV